MNDAALDYLFWHGPAIDGDLSRFAPDSKHPDRIALDKVLAELRGHTACTN